MSDSPTIYYQDAWVDGSFQRGYRECASRYEAIKKILQRLPQPFTVLDIGSNCGYFSKRIVDDFQATCTLIEGRSQENKLIRQMKTTDLRLIEHWVQPDDLCKMAEREQYDVVLALSILHHLPETQRVIDAIFRLGKVIFVETADELGADVVSKPPEFLRGITHALQERNPEILTHTQGWGPHDTQRALMVFNKPETQHRVSYPATVFSGNGYMRETVLRVSEQLKALGGYPPYPGTLNIRLPKKLIIPQTKSILIDGVPQYFWPVFVNKYPCFAFCGHHWSNNVVEVLTDVSLRGQFNLSDGDTVQFEIMCDYSSPPVPYFPRFKT